jgi:hypothetical protein
MTRIEVPDTPSLALESNAAPGILDVPGSTAPGVKEATDDGHGWLRGVRRVVDRQLLLLPMSGTMFVSVVYIESR